MNIPCGLLTTGDWHTYCYNWENPETAESEGSIFGDYGIEGPREVFPIEGEHYIADHIRASLDLIAAGRFGLAAGMKEDYISNDGYTPEIFEKVMQFRSTGLWPCVDDFMNREYRMEWIRYKNNVSQI